LRNFELSDWAAAKKLNITWPLTEEERSTVRRSTEWKQTHAEISMMTVARTQKRLVLIKELDEYNDARKVKYNQTLPFIESQFSKEDCKPLHPLVDPDSESDETDSDGETEHPSEQTKVC
jgi:hypothetical protein